MAKGKKSQAKEEIALLPQLVADKYMDHMHINFPIEEVADLKIGQEVVLSITGCIAKLEGKSYGMEKGCIGLQVKEKSLRKTSSPQAEGLRKLVEDDEYY